MPCWRTVACSSVGERGLASRSRNGTADSGQTTRRAPCGPPPARQLEVAAHVLQAFSGSPLVLLQDAAPARGPRAIRPVSGTGWRERPAADAQVAGQQATAAAASAPAPARARSTQREASERRAGDEQERHAVDGRHGRDLDHGQDAAAGCSRAGTRGTRRRCGRAAARSPPRATGRAEQARATEARQPAGQRPGEQQREERERQAQREHDQRRPPASGRPPNWTTTSEVQ